ncbi:MAG: hypothetical protein QNK59_01250 [Flavobacteriales bacterium]
MIKRLSLLLMIPLVFSCQHPVEEIPINDIHAHRLHFYLNNYSDDELFGVYENMYLDNENYKNEPYIYYFLSRFENKRYYLDEGLEKFPEDPFLNFNKKRYVTPNDEKDLYLSILDNHPRFNLAMINLFIGDEEMIANYMDGSDRELIESDMLFVDYSGLVYRYKHADSATSDYHNFNDLNYGLTESQIEIINTKLDEILEINERRQDALSNCENKESSLRSYEVSRIGGMSYMTFNESPDVQYIGDCEYRVSSNVSDDMYYHQYNIIMTYYYNYGSWDKVSSVMYKAVNGQWVEQ